MSLNEFINSPEFKRSSSTAADSGLKLFFKGVEWVVSFTINFIKLLFSQIFRR